MLICLAKVLQGRQQYALTFCCCIWLSNYYADGWHQVTRSMMCSRGSPLSSVAEAHGVSAVFKIMYIGPGGVNSDEGEPAFRIGASGHHRCTTPVRLRATPRQTCASASS